MNKVLSIVLGLTILATLTLAGGISDYDGRRCCPDGAEDCKNIVCQPCTEKERCPECFDENGNLPDWHVPCCQQMSQVVALTAASVSAATEAFAAAEACSFAATRVAVAASAGAAVGAFVSICQSVSLSINAGRCCEVASDVSANASSYAASFATAAAEARAWAGAAAKAASAASAASAAASSLFAQAESLIQSSCCGFDLKVYSSVLAAGNYAVNAKACVDVAVEVSTYAEDTAHVCVSAASASAANTGSLVAAKIDNCCVSDTVSKCAGATAATCLKVVQKAKDLHGAVEEAGDQIASYAFDENCIETPLTLIDDICAKECSDVSFGCCHSFDRSKPCSCRASEANCCLASRAVVDVFLAAKATAETTAQAAVYSKSKVAVYAAAIASAFTAAQAASATAVSVTTKVQSCCSITVVVDTAALAKASAIAIAWSKAKAAAEAHSGAAGHADAIAQATARAVAAARAAVAVFNDGCCGQGCCSQWKYFSSPKFQYSCCGLSKTIAESFSHEYINLVSTACSDVASESHSASAASTSASAADCTNIIRRVTTRSAFLLQCCCCTTKNSVASTAKNSYFKAFRW